MMDTNEKADTSEATKLVENDEKVSDLKLPENEGDKAKENGDEEKKDDQVPSEAKENADEEKKEDEVPSENTEKKQTGGKDTEGEESVLENEEIDKEMAEFLTEVPTEGEKGAEVSGTEDAEKAQSKKEPKEVPKLPMYCEKALAISGLPIRKLGKMKQMLLDKLGSGTVRIKPRARDEKLIHIYFASEDLLHKGKAVLEEQLSYTLKLKIVSGLGLRFMPTNQLEIKDSNANQSDNAHSSVKRKMEEDSTDEPPAKKDRYTENQDFYFNEESYDDQVKFKNKDARKIVEEFGRNLRRNIPQLEILICNRERKNDGLVCKLDELAECSPAQRLFARCKFVIGIDEDTGEVAVGFSTAEGKVKKNCKTRQYFLPNILQEADVFERLVKSSEREPGKGTTGFWRKLIVRSSTEGKVMLNVVVQAPKEKAQEELEYLKGIITEFYEFEAGKNSKVTSVYSKVMYISHRQKRSPASSVGLSWGSEYLEEKFLGMRLLLDPKTFFYFNVHAAGIICNTITELLRPSRRISVIEIGCFSGYLGMHLARFKCEVLCVGTKPASAEAVLKEQTSKCHYYPGVADEVLKTLKMSSTKACAVVTTSPQALAPKVSLELRKKSEIKRIVIITEAAGVNNSRALTLLMKPSDSKELGNPFFPKDIVPVDTMPNTKHYTLVILMERICMDSLPKPEPAYSSMKMGKPFQSRTNMPPNRMGPYQNFGSVWDERALPSGGLNPLLSQPFVENQLITPLNDPKLMYVDILQRHDFINNEILVEEHRRRLLEEREAEVYRQRLLEEKEREAEEYRQRLIEEKEREVEEYRRRLIEEKQREAAEYQRRLQEERAAEEYKQMQLKERLRILEEEEYKRRLLIEARERELRELSSKPSIQEVLSHTIKEAALSRLDNEAAGKLKHVIAEAIRGAGILNPEEQAMMHSGQDRIMSGTQYSRYAPERQNPAAGTGVADKSSIRNPRDDRNLPFKDSFSHKRINEREPMGDRRGFDNPTHTARMTSGRTERDVHPRSLDNREMSFSSRLSKESEGVNKNKPVSLLSLKFHPNIEANCSMPQELAGDERWRDEDDMYRRNWADDMNRGMGRSEPWRTDSKQAGRSDNEPYFRDVRDMKQDNWRSYSSNDMLTGSREAYGSESRMHVGRDTNRGTETGYGSFGGSHNLKPSVYGHIYGRVKQSEVDSYRKPY